MLTISCGLCEVLTPPRRLSSYDDGEENAAHPHMMNCRLRRNACIEERCQKGKEDLSQASFKYTHFAVAGKSSYEDERRSLRHHHMMISDAEGLNNNSVIFCIFIVTAEKDLNATWAFRFNSFCYIFASSEKRL